MSALLALSLMLAASPAAAADPNDDAAKAFLVSLKTGGDLHAAYPDAVSAEDAASLQRLRECKAYNFMRQKRGRYTIVWQCQSETLGMGINVTDGKLVSVETFPVVRRPNVSRR